MPAQLTRHVHRAEARDRGVEGGRDVVRAGDVGGRRRARDRPAPWPRRRRESAAGRAAPRARRRATSRSAVARPEPGGAARDHRDRARDLHGALLLSDGVATARSITESHVRLGPTAGAALPDERRAPLDPHPRGASRPSPPRPRGRRARGDRHRGGQPAPLPGQALPRPDRLRRGRARISWIRSPADLSALGAVPRRSRHGQGAPRRRQRPRVPQAPATASRWRRLFDTAVAARCLGVTALGLDELLRTFLGVDPGKSRQKDDWSRRPLTAEQETYALNDVLHLTPLRERLTEESTRRGAASLARRGVRGAGRARRADAGARIPTRT